MKKVTICIVICLLLFSVNHANAALYLSDVDGTWLNPVGGSGIGYQTDTVLYGNTSQDQVRWGDMTALLTLSLSL